MGIRFRCHLCQAELHVKDFLAGKRGRCPECGGAFRIPLRDSEFSLRPDDRSQLVALSQDKIAAKGKSNQLELPETIPLGAPASKSPTQPTDLNVPPTNLGSTPLAHSVSSSIAEAPSANWYVRPKSGGQYGPVTGTVVWQWLLENRIGPESLVWREDWAQWRPALDVFKDHFADGVPPIPNQPSEGIRPAAPTIPITPPRSTVASTGTELLASSTMTSVGQRNREARKQKRQRNYLILVSSLVVIFVVLLISLVVVLWIQYA